MKSAVPRAFVVLLVLIMSACAQQKIKRKVAVTQAAIPTETINIDYRETLAKTFFNQQDFYAALTQWKILRTINPNNTEYANRISVLNVLMTRRVELYLRQSKVDLRNGNLKKAENKLLKLLAIDPNNPVALKMMRRIESDNVQAIQIAKTNKLLSKQHKKYAVKQDKDTPIAPQIPVEPALNNVSVTLEEQTQESIYLAAGKEFYHKADWGGAIREINKYLSSNDSTPDIEKILKKSHIEMSRKFEVRGHWDPAIQHLDDALVNAKDGQDTAELKQKRMALAAKAAENYYIEGVKVYRDDVERAILFWQQALNHNPRHLNAKNRLKKAEVIQQNLEAIRHDPADS